MIYEVQNKRTKEVSIEQVEFFLSNKKRVGLDIETTKKFEGQIYGEREGLDPYTSKIIMIQIGDENIQYVLDARKLKKETIINILNLVNECEIVGQNLKFEYRHILYNYGIRLNNLFDTMIAEGVLECGDTRNKLSLKSIAIKYLGEEMNDEIDKSIRLQFLTIGDNDFTEEQILYGAGDIILPMKIITAQLRKLMFLDLYETFLFEKDFIPVLGNMEHNGMFLDKEKWLNIFRYNLEKFYKLENQLNSYIEEHPEFAQFLDEEGKCNILWTSSKQVVPVMQTLGIDTWVKDKILSRKKGKAHFKHSVEAKHLRRYMQYDLVKLYIKYKTLEKYVTSYGEAFLEHVNPITERIHPEFWQIVSTGRTSCKNPNLQNITSGEFRDCFTPQFKENKLICCDFSQQEPRITAHYSQDPSLMDLFLHGDGDTHSLIARKVFEAVEHQPQNITKENEGWSEKFNMTKRKVGKTINLGLDYGKSAFSLKHDLGISQEESESIFNAVINAFPYKEKYFERKRKETLKNGYVLIDPIIRRKSFMKFQLNRYRYLLKKKELNEEERSELFSIEGMIQRNSNNYPSQGTAASMTKYALILIYEYQKQHNAWDWFQIVNAVHDEIVAEASEEYAARAGKIIQWAMLQSGKRFCSSIPMVAEPQISDKWEH